MPRVILAEPNRRYDLQSASQFGDIVYLTTTGQNHAPFNPLNTKQTTERMQEAFEELNFDPEQDFICMTGQSLTVAIMLSIAAARYPTVRVLMFDSRNSSYVERIFSNTLEAYHA